jgi:VIT1/CCC1 family predicted Fe2+/Mn2+ transporter
MAGKRTEPVRTRRGLSERLATAGHRHRVDEPVHLGGKSGSLRAAIFGVSDGLVSNLALILGVAGSGVSSEAIVIAGIAGLLAGAFSMGTGEYLSMSVQREVFEHDLAVEAREIEMMPEAELDELTEIYRAKGLSEDQARSVSRTLMQDPKRALDAHAREELGLDPEELGSPVGAAVSSFTTFCVGAFVPLLPYLLAEGTAAFVGSLVAGAIAMTVIGGMMSRMVASPVWKGSLRMTLLGIGTAMVTFAIGNLFDVAVS